MATTTNSENIFEGLKTPRNVTQYSLFRGVTDFTNLAQFNLFETGYPELIVCRIPKYLETLAATNSSYKSLIDNYKHILEYEFRGLDGLENITTDSSDLNNGINTLQVITKVNRQGSSQFSMRYNEKSGSIFNRFHELFLTGIKDARTQVKTYHGLIESGAITDPGYEYETFDLLYFVTDNTKRLIEQAVFITCAQLTNAELQIYNVEKGTYEWKEIGVEMNGFPISNPQVTAKAQEYLNWILSTFEFREPKFKYNSVTNLTDVSSR